MIFLLLNVVIYDPNFNNNKMYINGLNKPTISQKQHLLKITFNLIYYNYRN